MTRSRRHDARVANCVSAALAARYGHGNDLVVWRQGRGSRIGLKSDPTTGTRFQIVVVVVVLVRASGVKTWWCAPVYLSNNQSCCIIVMVHGIS